LKKIYTIGYSAFKIEKFIAILKQLKVTCVVDVRSIPYSQYFKTYDKEMLSKILSNKRIFYKSFSDEFGAKQTDRRYFASEGYLDFSKYVKSIKFETGYQHIITEINSGQSFCLMCAEADPIDCHRSIMIGRRFYSRGFEVIHVMNAGEIQTQQELEERLLDKYFKCRNQLSLFEDNYDKNKLIEESYELKNKEIGYRLIIENNKSKQKEQ